MSGVTVLKEGFVPVDVAEHRDQLLAIKRGKIEWGEVSKLRLDLHMRFDEALADTKLPERPDYARANVFLINARRAMVKLSEKT
jgi:hypothetical protein